MYGQQIKPTIGERHHVIGQIESAPAGNVILRVGRLHREGWTQIGHVVMTPTEAITFAVEVLAAAKAAYDQDAR